MSFKDCKVVRACVLSFKKGTACRGLRAQHLQDSLTGECDVFERDLTKLVNAFAAGAVPEVLAPYYAGASLTALVKTKNGIFDVRPIAAGDILRRLVSKCLCATQKVPAAAYFGPGGQYGVACKAGTERVIHLTRHVVQREASGADPDCASTRKKNQTLSV